MSRLARRPLVRLFTRRVLARWLRQAARVVLLLAWLSLVVGLLHYAEKPGGRWDRVRLVLGFCRFLRSLEVAVALGAPLGMVMALAELRDSRVLTSYLTAGVSALGSLRRALTVAAVLTCAVALVCLEATAGTRRYVEATLAARNGALWTSGDVYVWQPRPASAQLILFRDSDLAVSSVAAPPGLRPASPGPASGGSDAECARRRPLVGEQLDLPAERPERLGSTAGFPPPPSHWSGVRDVLAGVCWLMPGAALLLICGYVALLVPTTYQWMTYVVFGALVPAVGILMLSSLVSLWAGNRAGLLVGVLWIPGVLVIVVGLDRLLGRRGIRT